ncbi:hypothetical protein H6G20_07505 [Desertifilum sp. FACHB-1129]|uniref:Uncharacterized protein n=2 Tax=Desertifilum tharense IPPAS B-1220 TaxID=1781255 RepID=A0A1E5QMG5_9CYAN|nr:MULTISPECIES: hypothetical protein [Desertifilum]MDA0210502.1 hypothetical protein [Cyanobacteria bacterium FC1]MBD2311502.1 hypothetical protein [Desertifilum sp. FACHB-1129]MBD2323076.1 hypothetical protein [Desertifilum sp. FACHB-866]MBD2332921.1 hypothetical protein [Desertifilum sp. FACHB-868]OEJ75777.1 hypothetical protein BH720_07545 [Desertifilum tharense IPPAS B-1220]
MNRAITRILFISLLLLAILAPFAGLAPLMILLLVFGLGWGILSLVQILLLGANKNNPDTP